LIGKKIHAHTEENKAAASEASFSQDASRVGRVVRSSDDTTYELRNRHHERIAEIEKIAATLSPREMGILRSPKRFEEEVRRKYRGGRMRFIDQTLRNYAAIKHIFYGISPDPRAKERRWSPPKGAPLGNKVPETHLDVLVRETYEETGLCFANYQIRWPDSPFVFTYVVFGCTYKMVFYAGRFVKDFPYPLFNEASTNCFTSSTSLPMPIMPDEIERVALLPISLFCEYFPREYGSALQQQLEDKLNQPDDRYLAPSGDAPSLPTLEDELRPKSPIVCSLRDSTDGHHIAHIVSNPIVRDAASATSSGESQSEDECTVECDASYFSPIEDSSK
jgi:8-oxo-dGTP pyrophosphatase MutT (NUDIX family)